VKLWIKNGMQVIDPKSKPFLISGIEAKQFLRNKSQNAKVKLKYNEFYCFKCHTARESQPDAIGFEITGKLLGNGQKQVTKWGICLVCTSVIKRFSSERESRNNYEFEKLREKGVIL
jgi:hypothetical protein